MAQLPRRFYTVAATAATFALLTESFTAGPAVSGPYLAAILALAGLAAMAGADRHAPSPPRLFELAVLLYAIVHWGRAEALLAALAGVAGRWAWQGRKFRQTAFPAGDAAAAAVGAWVSWHACHALPAFGTPGAPLAAAALALGVSYGPLWALAARTKREPHAAGLREAGAAVFRHTVLGAALAWCAASLYSSADRAAAAVLTAAAVVLFLGWRRLHGSAIEAGKKAEEMQALELRTLETMALAVGARDGTQPEHFERLCLYSVEIGRELGLAETEIEGLRRAALLHDIGELAVPEHILNSRGAVSAEDLEKRKIHPVVGAEIAERIGFRDPVAPVILAHHERWDGSGYPHGISGAEIPMAARILAVVDTLDSLATEKPGRPALALDAAMAAVAERAGELFDPRVVECVAHRYRDLEQRLEAGRSGTVRLEAILAGSQLREDLERIAAAAEEPACGDFHAWIVTASRESQDLLEMVRSLGKSLRLEETLAAVAQHVSGLVPCDAVAIYFAQGGTLVPGYTGGTEAERLRRLRIPWGAGVSGSTAAEDQPAVNGAAAIEYASGGFPGGETGLTSVLSVPFATSQEIRGVIALYHSLPGAFTADHLRRLLAVRDSVAHTLSNAIKYSQAESSATTDYLTQLPNARALFAHLETELVRAKRTRSQLAVLVIDLDGFKRLNDTYGHLEGNRLLQLVGTGLKQACRQYDFVARMGGDEFVVVLPGLDPEGVRQRAVELARLAVDAGIEVAGKPSISMSIGPAFFPDDGDEARALLEKADQRMYRFKQERKSRRASPPAAAPEPVWHS